MLGVKPPPPPPIGGLLVVLDELVVDCWPRVPASIAEVKEVFAELVEPSRFVELLLLSWSETISFTDVT
jgi:hypothetical protein